MVTEAKPESRGGPQVTPQASKPQATDSPTAMSCPGMAPVQVMPPSCPLQRLTPWEAGKLGVSRQEGLLWTLTTPPLALHPSPPTAPAIGRPLPGVLAQVPEVRGQQRGAISESGGQSAQTQGVGFPHQRAQVPMP